MNENEKNLSNAGVMMVETTAPSKPQIEIFFEVFYELLKKINDYNVVISGAIAIKAHGLYLNRQASDLDVGIYLPTSNQTALLDTLSVLSQSNTYEFCGQKKVYSFIKGAYRMDIMIENEREPSDLLEYKYNGDYFKIQSVANIINAKRKYNREKDWRDFADLKNRNFNF